jgi:hypothetical protein
MKIAVTGMLFAAFLAGVVESAHASTVAPTSISYPIDDPPPPPSPGEPPLPLPLPVGSQGVPPGVEVYCPRMFNHPCHQCLGDPAHRCWDR